MRRILAATTALIAFAGVAQADDLIRLAADESKCIHKKNSDYTNGNPVHLWDCNTAGSDAHAFLYDQETGYLRFKSAPEKCLHKKNGDYANGNPVHMWDCSTSGSQAHAFDYDVETGELRFRSAPTKCLHKKFSDTDNGNPLHLWSCNGNANSSWIVENYEVEPEPVAVPTNTLVLLKSIDSSFSVRSDGDTVGAVQSLGACDEGSTDEACQWVFEASTTRAGAYYIKRFGTDLYLHTNGGASAGNTHTLHACPKADDHPNCQWTVEASSTRDGAYYIKSAGADLYLHNSGGSTEGAQQTLHACPEANDHGNCQFAIVEILTVNLVGDEGLGTLPIPEIIVPRVEHYIRLAADDSKCVHKEDAGYSNNNAVHLWDCSTVNSDANAFFYDTDTGYLHFTRAPEKCLRRLNGNYDNGNPVHVYDCDPDGSAVHAFDYEADTGLLRFRGAPTKCLHKANNSVDNGTALHIWNCDEHDNARWIVESVTDADDTITLNAPAVEFDIDLPPAIVKALGDDPETDDVSRQFAADDDTLSIVRVTAVSLRNNAEDFLNDGLTLVEDFEDAHRWLRVELSDGTSAFYNSAGTQHLEALDGALAFTRGAITDASRFIVVSNDDDAASTTLETLDGTYVSFNADGSTATTATTIGDTETIDMIDVGQLAMDAMPSFLLRAADLDGDGDKETILFMEQEDGTGFLMFDPLGIADMLYKTGYAPDDAYVAALSATQREALFAQIGDLHGLDSSDELTGAEIEDAIEAMDNDNVQRNYFTLEFEYVLQGSLYSGEATAGAFGGSLTIGDLTVRVEDGLLLPNYELALTVLSVEFSLGDVSVETAVASAQAHAEVRKNGIMAAAGASLISVTVQVGDSDGSYLAVQKGVGVGARLGASWGQNDQYGVTVALPVLPVAVSIYVKGSDVVDMAEEVRDWTFNTANKAKDAIEKAWKKSSKWAKTKGKKAIAATRNTLNDKVASGVRLTDVMFVISSDSTEKIFRAIFSSFDSKLDKVANALRKSIGDPLNTVLNAVDNFFKFRWL